MVNHVLMSKRLRCGSWTPASLSVCNSEMPRAELRSVLLFLEFSLQPVSFLRVLLPIVLNLKPHTPVRQSRSRNAAKNLEMGKWGWARIWVRGISSSVTDQQVTISPLGLETDPPRAGSLGTPAEMVFRRDVPGLLPEFDTCTSQVDPPRLAAQAPLRYIQGDAL